MRCWPAYVLQISSLSRVSSRGRPEDRDEGAKGPEGARLQPPVEEFRISRSSFLSRQLRFLLLFSSPSSLFPLGCDGRHPLPSPSRIRSTNETLWPRIFYVSSILGFTIALARATTCGKETQQRDGFLYFLRILRGRKMTSSLERLDEAVANNWH